MRRLIIRPGALGDFVLALPAMEALRAGYTEVWTTSANVPLAGFADRAKSIANTGLDALMPTANAMRELATFDEIVSWYGAGRAEFREALAGLPVRFLAALPSEESMHATDFFLRQVGAPAGGVPRLGVGERERQGLLIHPYSGSAKKNWPLEKFERVAAELGELAVTWVVGPEERVPESVVREGGRWVRPGDRGELAEVLAGGAAYLGNDSGVSHVAAAVGTPTVVLFGPTNPAVWAPRGERVTVLSQEEAPAAVAREINRNVTRLR